MGEGGQGGLDQHMSATRWADAREGSPLAGRFLIRKTGGMDLRFLQIKLGAPFSPSHSAVCPSFPGSCLQTAEICILSLPSILLPVFLWIFWSS